MRSERYLTSPSVNIRKWQYYDPCYQRNPEPQRHLPLRPRAPAAEKAGVRWEITVRRPAPTSPSPSQRRVPSLSALKGREGMFRYNSRLCVCVFSRAAAPECRSRVYPRNARADALEEFDEV